MMMHVRAFLYELVIVATCLSWIDARDKRHTNDRCKKRLRACWWQ